MSAAHVCFVAPGTFPSLVPGVRAPIAGGAEIQQAMLMKMLVADGFRVSLLSLNFGQAEHCVAHGVHVHTLPRTTGRGVRGLRWLVPRLTDVASVLGRVSPTHIYVRTATAYLLPAAWYARRFNRKLIYAAASDFDFQPGQNPLLTRRDCALFKLGLRGVNSFIVQNQKQAQLLHSTHQRVGQVIPNLHHEAAAQPGAFEGPVIWVGSVAPRKRPEAYIELAAAMPHQRFVMMGGPGADSDALAYFEQIRQRASALSNLEFVGFVAPAEIGHRFDGAALLVNTSPVEGFPNTFLQAWTRGIPSLSFVRPSVDGGEVATVACTDVADMARQAEKLLRDVGLWQQQGDVSRRALQKHRSPEAVLPRNRQLLQAGAGA